MTDITIGGVYAVGVPIVLVIILIEVLITNWRNQSYYKHEDSFCTAGLLAGNIAVGLFFKGGTLALHAYLYQFRIINLDGILSVWAIWLLTFVLIDFIFYCYHRTSHRVRFLWAVHMSHHSSEKMNFLVSFRQAWFAPISKIPFFMCLPVAGLDPTIIAVAGVISTLWGILGHTQIIGNLGPLEMVFNTPSHHRVHHGSNDQYIDKNYGNLLIVWDRVFGAFEPENEAVKYGLVNNVETFDPIKITFMGWVSMVEDIKSCVGFREGFNKVFGPPNTRTRGGSF
ncbi:MAG: sterol desaturase family protein [Cellvibrionales bacterium TMED148]|nr:fatty acid hydroxylase [Porticoccaceae bacterium]RPG88529.1 MAG: sterol desaturase family protein [Cellvibrionales bacterium TMED148]